MRLVILGLDGLDPDLVDSWDMRWFKQRTWGKHYVGLLKNLYTPILWSCFLTGLNVEEHGYDINALKEKRMKEALRSRFLYGLYMLRRKIPIRKTGLRKLLIKLGLINPYQASIMPENLMRRNFLEELKREGYRVVAIEVPGYNETKNEYYRGRVDELVTRPFRKRVEAVDEALEDTRERVARAVEYVDSDYDIVFVYTPLPDFAFHMAVRPDVKVKVWLRTVHHNLYSIIEELINLAQRKGYAVLMVSDHGFDLRKYYHTTYGFWSLSTERPPWWKIRSILDFKDNILKLVRMKNK